ncbi:MAG: SNF2-related protein [Elusimicrobiota bacterium]
MSTPYHSKYYAYELTKRCASSDPEKLSQSLNNATIDLNPHQVDAALFAFRSPLSRGALLADEVGLGKTIEAGLVISQLWAERKRHILCILPAALRQQWARELAEKFFIDSIILESGSYKTLQARGHANPFEQKNKVVLCSFQFARREAAAIRSVSWDLVVVDEAHRLRNVYKTGNKIARAIRDVIGNRPKILLTATPLQNSLMELYGLISFIDPHLFGSDDSFREKFAKTAGDDSADEFATLRRRIQSVCQRTLRRQVLEYVRYTNRVSLTQDFTPTDQEWQLYESVSAYLQRPQSFALPAGQRALITLVLRKILASSSFAIADTLGALIKRLEAKGDQLKSQEADTAEALGADYESLAQTQEEWEGDQAGDAPAPEAEPQKNSNSADRAAIAQEIEDLKNYKQLAQSITRNEKGNALLIALKTGFDRAEKLGAKRKALIFTESRRTQAYLKELLQSNGYSGQLVTFNGTNSDPESQKIYKDWLARHAGQDCVTGSASADTRSALVEEFQDRASIMIATESAAEGINLQFCSLVVNYDLPWNPQRIEQRIGRCHRYGQKHDVVVINFVNRKNAADQRVFELLAQKFKLFEGIFGASDQVLGALESGVDFEKRVNDIYQSCRTTEEINAAFDKLKQELDLQIQSRLETAKTQLIENFDTDVQARLRLKDSETSRQRGRFHLLLWWLTKGELLDYADFLSEEALEFNLKKLPDSVGSNGIPLGRYGLLPSKAAEGVHHYRIGHALAEQLIAGARERKLQPQVLTFRYDPQDRKISLVEAIQGCSGWLQLRFVSVNSLEPEDHLVFSGLHDDGRPLDSESCAKLFEVPADVSGPAELSSATAERLEENSKANVREILDITEDKNRKFFEAEIEKMENWASDLKDSLESDLREMQKTISIAKREARQAADLAAKLEMHKKIADLERKRNEKRRGLFEAQDAIEKQKDDLLSTIEAKLNSRITEEVLFTVRWLVLPKA